MENERRSEEDEERLVSTVSRYSKESKGNPVIVIAFVIFGFVGGIVGSSFVLGNLHGPAGTPPEKVPVGLKAKEYLDLGKRYKQTGWTEQAREALNLAIRLDQGEVGEQSRIYLKAYIPRYPVTKAAIKKNIDGFNLMTDGDNEGAIKAFKQCIAENPRFEWPYGNLGAIYVEENKIAEAKEVLNTAVEINPHYVNAWLHLAEAYAKEGDKRGSRDCLAKATEADPNSSLVTVMESRLKK